MYMLYKQTWLFQYICFYSEELLYVFAKCYYFLLECLLTFHFSSAAYMHYYDNPKGMIPTWMINWAAKVSIEK